MKRRWKTEYSKIILGALTLFWFLGAILGGAIAADAAAHENYSPLDSVLVYIGAPMSGGVVSYMIKSAGENRERIRSAARSADNAKTEDVQS